MKSAPLILSSESNAVGRKELALLKFTTIFPFLIAMLSILLIVLLINSSYGRAFKAIRDDEIAAEAMGISLFRHKMLSFVISSFFAGVGGALLAWWKYDVISLLLCLHDTCIF